MSEAQRLVPDDAEALAALQEAYPSGMREGVERLRHKLTLLDSSNFTCAWGLFEHERIVAYVIAFPRMSSVEGLEKEFVVYIDDLFVAPEAMGKLYRLLKVLQFDLEEAQLSHYPIEALCRRSFFRLLLNHPDVFRRIGYELIGHYEYWDEEIGEEMCWIRLHPWGKGSLVERDEVSLSQDLLEEMRFDL